LLEGEAKKFPQTFDTASPKNKLKEMPANYLEQENRRENI
jgi:hypothetical protein